VGINIAGADRSIDERVDEAVDRAEQLVGHACALFNVSEVCELDECPSPWTRCSRAGAS
jgi:hypothetical protein